MAGCTDTRLRRKMVPTAGLPVHSSSYPGHWSPRLRRVGEAVHGYSDQWVGGGGGTAFRMWTGPLKPGWMPPPAAGASVVSLHQWTAVSSDWMSLSGLSSPGRTCIDATPLDGQHSFPQSTQAQSETYRNIMNWNSTHVFKLWCRKSVKNSIICNNVQGFWLVSKNHSK